MPQNPYGYFGVGGDSGYSGSSPYAYPQDDTDQLIYELRRLTQEDPEANAWQQYQYKGKGGGGGGGGKGIGSLIAGGGSSGGGGWYGGGGNLGF